LIPGKTNEFIQNGQKINIDIAYPYALFYVYYDQYLVIQGVLIMNIMIALIVIFVSVQIIMNIKSAFIITLFVFSCVFNLIGAVYLTNFIPGYIIEINAVSVVNLVLSCGLSVEFTVHVVIFYFRSVKKSSSEKVQYSLKNVGVAVLVGIVTTKIIGVSVLYFAPSKIFQLYYFRMFIFLIIIGFIHGFMILPIFLSIFDLGSDHKKLSLNKSAQIEESKEIMDQKNN